MNKVSSITLMIMGTGLLPVAYLINDPLLKSILLIGSIVLNIIAIVRNFKEKNKNNL